MCRHASIRASGIGLALACAALAFHPGTALSWGASDVLLGPAGSWVAFPAPPSPRYVHAACYDSQEDRMVVFGGYNTDNLNDTWLLSLSVSPHWTPLTPAGTPPSPRANPTAIYDPVRDRVIMFGGAALPGPPSSQVWELSLGATPTWTQLATAGTGPLRRGHTAIYDPIRDRMIVFGGSDTPPSIASAVNSVWALSLSGTPTWTQLTPSGTPPSARWLHTAIYDPVRDRMVVYGGANATGSTPFADVWALSLSGSPAWSQLTPSGTPPSARHGHAAVYDPQADRMVVFGGRGSGLAFFNDTWTLSLSGTPGWASLTPLGTAPSMRQDHSGIFDPLRGRLVVFGGYDYVATRRNDLWALSLFGSPAWECLMPDESARPAVRYGHTSIIDAPRNRMVVFGGTTQVGDVNDVWAATFTAIPSWTQLAPTGTPPSARLWHTAICDPERDRMLVFGGYGGAFPNGTNEVWALSLSGTPAWTQLFPAGTPPPGRFSTRATYDPVRDRVLVYGGLPYDGSVWALWLSAIGAPFWTQLAPTGTPPSARADQGMFYDLVRDRMIVFGGGTAAGYLNDAWALSLTGTPSWSQLTPMGSPPAARRGPVIYDSLRDRLAFFGGWVNTQNPRFNDTWELSLPGTPAWSHLTPSGTSPNNLTWHTLTYDPPRTRMLVYGGGQPNQIDLWALQFPSALVSVPGGIDTRPASIELAPPRPNPSDGRTTFDLTLPSSMHVSLAIYDLAGRMVRRLVDGPVEAGRTAVTWDGRDQHGQRAGAGIYIVRLAGPQTSVVRKLALLQSRR